MRRVPVCGGTIQLVEADASPGAFTASAAGVAWERVEPSSGAPFSEQDDTTWPCEEVRECAETLPDFEAIGSSLPEKPNAHVLEEKKLPSIAVPSPLPPAT